MSLVDWNTDSSGETVMMLPLWRFATLIAAESAVGIKLDYFEDGDSPDAPSGRLQLILTAQQANDLGHAMQSAAKIIRNKKL